MMLALPRALTAFVEMLVSPMLVRDTSQVMLSDSGISSGHLVPCDKLVINRLFNFIHSRITSRIK
jgi:hypothetical protein